MKLILSIILLLSVSPVNACEELLEFGCEPWVTCMPVAGGWKWIKQK